MATASARLRGYAWVERARVAGLARRILDVDKLFLRHDGRGMLTNEEAEVLRRIVGRLDLVER
jgi:hypothetical protein